MPRSKAQKAREEPEDVPYAKAVEEIEQILDSIDRDETEIDELSDKVERAVSLIRVCQEKLRATESKVTKVLADLDQEGDIDSQAGDNNGGPPEESPEQEEDDDLPF